MAGNIPPLVSSTPPPLNAFDDDDEEEEDEYGLYNTAEEIDYSECISFKEKDEQKQNVGKPRGEQDSTSQDSATDSGLCPDSEGMSPTPHSDDERTLKQNSCDKLCQKTGESQCPQGSASELGECLGNVSVKLETGLCPNLSNGHGGDGNCAQESDDDFGNFEFAPSHRVHNNVEEAFKENSLRSKSPLNILLCTEEENGGCGSLNIHPPSEQSSEKLEENENDLSNFNVSESNVNGLELEKSDFTFVEEESCIYEQSNSPPDEVTAEKLDLSSSNDSSSFNSVDNSIEQKNAISIECKNNEQSEPDSMEKTTKDHEHFDGEEKEKEIPPANGDDDDDDEFDDFTDFKAVFSSCYDLPKSEQGDEVTEHSKTRVGQTKLEEAALSLPPSHQEESDDEFSNFADFSSSDCAFVSAQSSNSLENVSHIPLKLDDSDLRTESEFQDWVSVFPCKDDEEPPVASALLREDDVVWSRLFPLESSPALSYQWNESLANRRLLTALNIDSRNILFTPWSTSAVPRFAANLSCGPLEPIKATEPLQPSSTPPSTITTTITTTTTTTTTTQESVPDAHFDWVGSGLTNPLDCPKTVLNLPKTLSAEAEKILISLPDISYMRKTYIDFPISEA